MWLQSGDTNGERGGDTEKSEGKKAASVHIDLFNTFLFFGVNVGYQLEERMLCYPVRALLFFLCLPADGTLYVGRAERCSTAG